MNQAERIREEDREACLEAAEGHWDEFNTVRREDFEPGIREPAVYDAVAYRLNAGRLKDIPDWKEAVLACEKTLDACPSDFVRGPGKTPGDSTPLYGPQTDDDAEEVSVDVNAGETDGWRKYREDREEQERRDAAGAGAPVERRSGTHGRLNGREDYGLVLTARIFMIFGCIATGWAVIPLLWTVPMTVWAWNRTEDGEELGMNFKVCVLLFESLVAGILLLCDEDA